MSEPKKGTGKHPGKKHGRRLYTDENPETQFRLNSLRRRMRARRWRKLKKYLSRLLEKFKS